MDKEKLRKLWSEYNAAQALFDKFNADVDKAFDAENEAEWAALFGDEEYEFEWDRLYNGVMHKAIAFRDALSELTGIKAATAWHTIFEHPEQIEEILR